MIVNNNNFNKILIINIINNKIKTKTKTTLDLLNSLTILIMIDPQEVKITIILPIIPKVQITLLPTLLITLNNKIMLLLTLLIILNKDNRTMLLLHMLKIIIIMHKDRIFLLLLQIIDKDKITLLPPPKGKPKFLQIILKAQIIIIIIMLNLITL